MSRLVHTVAEPWMRDAKLVVRPIPGPLEALAGNVDVNIKAPIINLENIYFIYLI
ncbi:hypothetical protein DSM106972_005880 [Dulcicalothrix desertica PCC 7102]|uniref:Uncharacterized protein n=1 Tax=Dulcicalothrix desertica PCC 7102 TaxID=232991 RepID=A0A433VVH6_9CYAN|nr:hypothetical protein DSM106972_005880 [Dulcicalothrix desertica PCC 7102]